MPKKSGSPFERLCQEGFFKASGRGIWSVGGEVADGADGGERGWLDAPARGRFDFQLTAAAVVPGSFLEHEGDTRTDLESGLGQPIARLLAQVTDVESTQVVITRNGWPRSWTDHDCAFCTRFGSRKQGLEEVYSRTVR